MFRFCRFDWDWTISLVWFGLVRAANGSFPLGASEVRGSFPLRCKNQVELPKPLKNRIQKPPKYHSLEVAHLSFGLFRRKLCCQG